jgi:hypothetical protein
LTNQANSPKLEREGGIFMPATPAGGGPDVRGGAPISPESGRTSGPTLGSEGEKATHRLEELKAAGPGAEGEGQPQRGGRFTEEARMAAVINNIRNASTKEAAHQLMMEELREYASPHSAPMTPDFINAIIQKEDDVALDYLVNRIISQPLDSETSDYVLSFYGNINLEYIKDLLRAATEEHVEGENPQAQEVRRTRYQRILLTADGVRLFHIMNAQIITGKTEDFIRVAENVNPLHFKAVQEIAGVPQAMRVYEQEYMDMLARDERISTEGYKELRARVRTTLRLWRDNGLLTGESGGGMEDWEIERAVNLGRTFFNLTFRAAELVSLSQLPQESEKGGEKRYASFPQESAARLMNWMVWMNERFRIAGVRGGEEFLKDVKEKYLESLKLRGLKKGINQIIEIGGVKVEDIEIASIFATSGIFSSWRLENMALGKLTMDINGQKVTLRDWLDQEIGTDSQTRKPILRRNEIMDKKTSPERRLELLRPLIDGTDIGLGILLRQGFATDEKGYEVRMAIWKKVMDGGNLEDVRAGNMPLIIDYLNNIKTAGLDVANLRGLMATQGMTEASFTALKQKILLQHEVNIRRAMYSEGQFADQTYTDAEKAFILALKQEGLKLAPHLADINFAFTPFMNDTPFELLDFSGPGEEFYKRRMGGDLPSYNKAQAGFTSLMNNPGGIAIEKALEVFDGIIKGIESPQGTTDAQLRIEPLVTAWLEFVMTLPGQRQALLKSAKELANKPTSTAQEFAGPEALSLNEADTRAVIGQVLKAGIISVDLADDIRKKLGIGFLGLLFSLLRDYFYVPFVSFGTEFSKRTVKE